MNENELRDGDMLVLDYPESDAAIKHSDQVTTFIGVHRLFVLTPALYAELTAPDADDLQGHIREAS